MTVTEKKIVKIDRQCKENPVFVTWTTTPGGREYWLFHKVQTKLIDTEGGGDFEPYIEELEEARGQIFDLSVEAVPKLVVGAMVEIEDVEGIKTMLNSVSVEMLTNPETWETEGLKWMTVRPQKGSFRLYDTDEIRTTIEVTLSLPYIFNQQR
jgi:hypothetical protein